jgi:hypothetical protein
MRGKRFEVVKNSLRFCEVKLAALATSTFFEIDLVNEGGEERKRLSE